MKKHAIRPLVIPGFAVLALVGGAALYAQTPPRPNASPATASSVGSTGGKKVSEVKASGKQLVGEETPQGTLLTATGNLTLTSEDMTLTTAKALWNDNTKVATSPGKVTITDPENTLTGNTGTAYYRTKDAKIRGNVVINTRPKPNTSAPEGSPRREFRAPAVITCESVDYNWRSKVAVATGNLKVVQKDRTVTADKCVFEGKQDRVTLEGNVVYTKANGEQAKATKVVIIITEGKEKFTANDIKEAIFKVEEDEETPATPGNTGNPPAGTGTGGNTGNPAGTPETTPPATPPATPPGTPPANPPVRPDPAKPGSPGGGGGNP
jgi:lipopolysaccharide assembly outer membrane protein LptD (OstA)